MPGDDRARWNLRHASRAREDDGEPLALLVEHASLLPAAGRALDVACGRGRESAFLAAHGLEVLAVDVSDEALERTRECASARGLRVETQRRDVVEEGLPPGTWDVVLVAHFLERSLFPALRAALRPGGLLFYETFTAERAERSGGSFPRRYCLEPGELREAFAGLDLVTYREAGDVASLVGRAPVGVAPSARLPPCENAPHRGLAD